MRLQGVQVGSALGPAKGEWVLGMQVEALGEKSRLFIRAEESLVWIPTTPRFVPHTNMAA